MPAPEASSELECWVLEISVRTGSTFRCFDEHSAAMRCYHKIKSNTNYHKINPHIALWNMMEPPQPTKEI